MTTLQSLTERFKSGNDIEVERIHITRKEFDALTTQQWLPISSAPKDGTIVLLGRSNDPDWPLRCRRWDRWRNRWRGGDGEEATHWQHLPAPPTD